MNTMNTMNNEMYGVVDGLYYCNMNRTNELNERISSRNVPSNPLQPQFSCRPVSTKYEILPIFDRRQLPTVAIQRQPTFNMATTFNPGTAYGPWSGFAANVNDESTLRNQFFAIQKNPEAYYVPSSTSDMYQVHVNKGAQLNQPFPNLFRKQQFEKFNPNECDIGKNIFDNFTRQQVKDLD